MRKRQVRVQGNILIFARVDPALGAACWKRTMLVGINVGVYQSVYVFRSVCEN